MRKTLLLVLLVHVMALPVAFAEAAEAPMIQAGKTVKLSEQVYVIPHDGVLLVPNVGIVVGRDGVLVVDTGMGPANAEIVISEVRKITDKPILYLASTHFHPEHNFGAQAFPDTTTFIYSSAQYGEIREKGEPYRLWFMDMFGDGVRELLELVKLREPDITFDRRARINLGDLPVELIHFGNIAHTSGDTVVYLPEQKILFSGGLTPNEGFAIVPPGDSSIKGWIETLDELEELDVTTIVPGHGDIADAKVTQRVKTYLTSLQARASSLHADGVALADAQQQLFAKYTEQYPDWREPNWITNAVELVYAESAAND